MVVSDAVSFCRAASGSASSEKGVTERARENRGGKTTGWRSAVYTAIVTQSNFTITQGERLTEALSAGGIRPMAAIASRKGLAFTEDMSTTEYI